MGKIFALVSKDASSIEFSNRDCEDGESAW